jgi:hypothetical protein
MQTFGTVVGSVIGFELVRHHEEVVEEEVSPESAADEVVIHVIFGHLQHCRLDVDVQISPQEREGSFVGVIKG